MGVDAPESVDVDEGGAVEVDDDRAPEMATVVVGGEVLRGVVVVALTGVAAARGDVD